MEIRNKLENSPNLTDCTDYDIESRIVHEIDQHPVMTRNKKRAVITTMFGESAGVEYYNTGKVTNPHLCMGFKTDITLSVKQECVIHESVLPRQIKANDVYTRLLNAAMFNAVIGRLDVVDATNRDGTTGKIQKILSDY